MESLSLLLIGYRGLLPCRQSGRSLKLFPLILSRDEFTKKGSLTPLLHTRLYPVQEKFKCAGSVVGIASMLRAGQSGVQIPVNKRNFLRNVQTGSGALYFLGFFLGDKASSCAAVKSGWSVASTLSIYIYAVDRNTFTFTRIS
jgi:hypothetical protein